MRSCRLLTIASAGISLLLGIPQPADAHEVRPAYWEVNEVAPGEFELLWKQPVFADQEPGVARRLPVDPVMPSACEELSLELAVRTEGAIVQRAQARCPEGLEGLELRIAGLQRTLMDVLLRLQLHDGTQHTVLLKPQNPTFTVSAEQETGVPTYLVLGIEHMLLGTDHLLFVLGLVLLSRKVWEVVRLVTAFTVAHSITLGLTALGYISVPQGPIEATIALSILFLAVEALQPADRRSVLARNSWTVAFAFGLLHGFGFAGALAEIGLPESAKLPALFLFNLGVELGQLLTLAALFAAIGLVRFVLTRQNAEDTTQRRTRVDGLASATAAILIGVLAGYWFVERSLGLL